MNLFKQLCPINIKTNDKITRSTVVKRNGIDSENTHANFLLIMAIGPAFENDYSAGDTA